MFLMMMITLPTITFTNPNRQNSKRMSIFDAVPDRSFRSGKSIESERKGK